MTSNSAPPSSANEPAPAAPDSQVRLVVMAVFFAFLGQQTLVPVFAPLAAAVGLQAWHIGVVMGVAALTLVLTSQPWGRLGASWGRKKVLVGALGVGVAAMLLFAGISYLGTIAVLSSTGLFLLMVLTRGVLFGGALAAIMPTAQAFIAEVTPTERDRVKGMAGIGAAQGMSMVGGAVLGGVLSWFGVMVPLLAIPVLVAAAMLLVLLRLRPQSSQQLIKSPPKLNPFDSRIFPYLLAGFGMFTALGFVQVLMGFVMIERFGLTWEQTGLAAGGSIALAGFGMLLAQGVIVPRSGWSPRTLLLVGSPIAALGFLAMIPQLGLPVMFIAIGVIGLGLGIAMPGFIAGPSLKVTPAEQSGLAGLIGATSGLTFIVAPVLGTVLYNFVWRPLPLLLSALMMAATAAFVALHPSFRVRPQASATP